MAWAEYMKTRLVQQLFAGIKKKIVWKFYYFSTLIFVFGSILMFIARNFTGQLTTCHTEVEPTVCAAVKTEFP